MCAYKTFFLKFTCWLRKWKWAVKRTACSHERRFNSSWKNIREEEYWAT